MNETETLTEVVENAVRETVLRRRNHAAFLARGIRSLEAARQTNDYVDADALVEQLRVRLPSAKESARARIKKQHRA
ncbi:MAG: prevent-host-death protein [Burkholderiaceae bacterium]